MVLQRKPRRRQQLRATNLIVAALAAVAGITIPAPAQEISSAPLVGGSKTGIYQSFLPRAGNRIFIEPLVGKDADIDNQVNFVPYYQWVGKGRDEAVPLSIEKRITSRFSVEAATQLDGPPAESAGAWTDTGWGLQGKYLFGLSAKREIMASAIVKGDAPAGPPLSSQNPWALNEYLVFNKGFGDLPQEWLRPLALQSDIGTESPFADAPDGRFLRTDLVLEYSLAYLNDIVGAPVPPEWRQMTPAVEWRNRDDWAQEGDGGFLSWELNWQAKTWQLSLAYQNPYGAAVSGFAGTQVQLYLTLYYDNLLQKLGFNPTPY